MVELIITDSNHVDARSAADYTLDCAWGKEENDFELVNNDLKFYFKTQDQTSDSYLLRVLPTPSASGWDR